MSNYLSQIWKTKDLRKKIVYTVGILILYRLLSHIPAPGIDTSILKNLDQHTGLNLLSMLTGGSISRFSLVLMGLSPYINASIIIQLLTVIVPKLETLSKEGEQGRNTINRYTRYLAFPLAFIQSYGMIMLLNSYSSGQLIVDPHNPLAILPVMLMVTTGTIVIMWLGELITEKGIGNGISLIIFAGIVANMPKAIGNLATTSIYGDTSKIAPFITFVFITLAMLFAIIMFTEGSRNIPITYAGRGSRNEKASLPIRINQAGMIPIIFAVSMITFPSIIAGVLDQANSAEWVKSIGVFIKIYMSPTQDPSYLYMTVYFLLVIAFSYFYVSITFDPNKVAENIQKRGGFIPGIRPGKQTALFLGKVSNHLNLFGGIFLATVAVIPTLITKYSNLNNADLIISGSGLIIVVGVVLELIRQVNAQLVMHDYDKLV